MKRPNDIKSETTAATTTSGKSATPGKTTMSSFEVQRPTASKPTSEEIRRRAYEIFLKRKQTGEPGSPEGDWERAEKELLRKR